MPKMPRTLSSLLEPGFARGYDEFKEVVDFVSEADPTDITPREKVWIRLFELISVAMIEGMNRAEVEQELPPTSVIVELWNATGSVLATMNAQAFVAKGMPTVRREMLTALKAGYDRTAKVIATPENSGGA